MPYIYAQAGWPAFRWDREGIGEQLVAVRYRQGRLLGRMEALGFGLRTEATVQSLTEEVVTSSEIEGEILEREQVRSSVARRLGMDTGGRPPAQRHVEGIVDLMLDATQKYEQPLTAERLFGWHASLSPPGRRSARALRVGTWRDDHAGPMLVLSGALGREHVHYRAPDAARVPADMAAFLAWFNGNPPLDGVLAAAIAHLWFVTVHPFDDGNGRIARAIADLALARSEGTAQRFYSMSAQIRVERKAYYGILEATQKGGLDITAWLAWFLACLGRAIDGAETTLGTVLRKAHFWEAHGGASFNDRQRKLLNRLLDGFEGKLTSSKWAALAKCSQDTASRDIDDLVKRNVLVKHPGGGRSTSYGLAEGAGGR